MSNMPVTYLSDLVRRIDPNVERQSSRRWVEFLTGRLSDEVFLAPRRPPAQPQVDWPETNINDAIEDVELMVLSELRGVSETLAAGTGRRLNVRCNYGTGILPSLFGAEMFIMPRQTNTLPTVRPLGSADRIRAMLDKGIPDVRRGLGAKVFQCGERFLEVFSRYPILGEYVSLYHPDLQGPIDALELLWGSEVFLGFYDHTDLLKDALSLITETYIRFLRAWHELVPPAGEFSDHWGIMMNGLVMLRNDSLMNLSPACYVQFIRPCDQEILDALGGGAVHFCGRGDHYIEAMSEMRGLAAINMSQPECNDMETIYRNTVDKGIKILGLAGWAAESADRPLRGQVHCCEDGQAYP